MPPNLIANESSTSATVAPLAESRTTLYSLDGEPVNVATDRVEYWLARGFRRTPIDLDDELSTLEATAHGVTAPMRALVDVVRGTGTIDHAAYAAAQEALNEVLTAGSNLLRAVLAAYPVPQEDI